jgi:hypothetical protein
LVNPARRGRLGLELASLAVAGVVHGRRRVEAVLRELRGYQDLASLPLRFLYDRRSGGAAADLPLPLAYWGYRWNRTVRSGNELSYAARFLGDRLRGIVRRDLDRLKLAEYVAIPHRGRTDAMDADVERGGPVAFVVEDPQLAAAHRELGREVLLEVHPGLGMDAAELEDFALSRGIGLTLDTWHIRHDPERHQRSAAGSVRRSAGGDCGRWERDIERLLRVSGLIHFQPSRRKEHGDEMSRTLGGEHTELAAMVEVIRGLGYDGPVVVEYAFPVRDQLLDKGAVVSTGNEIAHYLRENLLGVLQSPPFSDAD